MRASFVYHQITAIISIISTLISLYWMYKNYNAKDSAYKTAIILILLSISWGVHGLIHFWEEVYFDFNPLAGKSTIHDFPVRNYNKN